MRSILASVVAVALLGTSAAAVAQPNGGFRGNDRGVTDNRGYDRDGRRDFNRNDRFDDRRGGYDRNFGRNDRDFGRDFRRPGYDRPGFAGLRWRPGMFVHDYRRFVVNDWNRYHLRRPPRGYYWVRQNNDFLMVAIATGVIVDVLLSNSYGPDPYGYGSGPYGSGPYGYGPGGYGTYYGR